MRPLTVLCGVVLAGTGACASLLVGSASTAVPRLLPTITTRPLPVFTLPLPKGPAGQVIFLSTRDGAAEIYQMADSGVGQTRLTSAFGRVADPTFSIDGRLTYSTLVGGNWEIVATGASKVLDQITHDASRARQPRWIDPETLAYVSDTSGNEDVWRIRPESGFRTNLTPSSPGPDLDPAPSPDGKQLAFASSPTVSSPAFDIYVLTLATKKVEQLTHDGLGNRRPSWSPDGERIVFDRSGNGGSDIWVMKADGSGAHSVIATGVDEFGASYAPARVAGKRRFAYVTNGNGNYEIWAANDDGSNAFDLSQSPAGDDFAVFWAPVPTKLFRIFLTPAEVVGAGGGPNTPVACTVSYKGRQPIVGTPHADVICGSNGPDQINGKQGNDQIYPRGGSDKVLGGLGDDYIYSRGGKRDFVRGNGGFDTAWVDDGDSPQGDVEASIP
jgi:hypothetical protein